MFIGLGGAGPDKPLTEQPATQLSAGNDGFPAICDPLC